MLGQVLCRGAGRVVGRVVGRVERVVERVGRVVRLALSARPLLWLCFALLCSLLLCCSCVSLGSLEAQGNALQKDSRKCGL